MEWLEAAVIWRWMPVFAAFVSGLVVGWLIWSRSGQDQGSRVEPGAPEARFGEIEAEIGEARRILDENADVASDFASDIDTVEQAVNRANGRLKLIARAIDRIKPKP